MVSGRVTGIDRALPVLLAALLLLCIPASAFAWPTAAQWFPIFRDGTVLQDDNGDTNGSRNVVSALPDDAAAYYFNDSAYMFFRLRLDDDPSGSGGQGLLKSFGWGFEIDTDQDAGSYEWLVMVDGIGTEGIYLEQNTVQGTLGDPGDKTEVTYASYSMTGNYQVNLANTSINGDADYFLDWRIPYVDFKTAAGVTDNDPIRMFEGSSSATNSLTENGADLVGPSDLYAGFSDYMTPLGTTLYTGAVWFVADLAGTGDVTQITQGDTVYIRVDDNDQNYDYTAVQTVTVTLTNENGDSETVTLTETGVNTGIFTGSIATAATHPAGTEDGTLQIMPGETVTVTYIDPIDATLTLDAPKTDTLTVKPPVMAVTKTVDLNDVVAGSTVTYTITFTNIGDGDGWLTTVQDVLPTGFGYVSASTSGLTTGDPSITGQQLTWIGSWTVPAGDSLTLIFSATAGSTAGTLYNNASASGTNFTIVSTGDTALVKVTAPLMEISKSVDKANAAPGEEVIYAVSFRNLGDGVAKNTVIIDSVPFYTTYVAGSLRIGTATDTWATASALTDADDNPDNMAGVTAKYDGGSNSMIFVIDTIAPDDAAADSGTDEGKVFFKITVD